MTDGNGASESHEDRVRGKGGSGKTTLSSLFTRHLAARGLPAVAIDADINQESSSG